MHPILFHLGPILIPSYGAMTAVGVLLALVSTQRAARERGLDQSALWSLCVLALLAGMVGSRLLLVVANRSLLRLHPQWLLGLATIHHPLVGAVGVLCGVVTAMYYARRHRQPLRLTADALAAPLALACAFEQWGALLAGSGWGVEAEGLPLRWAVRYSSPFAALWSGAPLGVALHPVQAYAALAFLAIFAVLWPMRLPRPGDLAGCALMASGVAVYLTEFWRDPEGRGVLLNGFLNAPQAVAIGLVLAGALLLLQWKQSGNEAVDGDQKTQ